jgi:CubicO group peptidase (beta-lactamase class C family)
VGVRDLYNRAIDVGGKHKIAPGPMPAVSTPRRLNRHRFNLSDRYPFIMGQFPGKVRFPLKGYLHSKIRGQGVAISAFVVGLIAASLIWDTLISSWATDSESEHQSFVISPGFKEIESRGLDVIVAFMNGNGSIVVRAFGTLKEDELDPEETLVDIGSITKTVTAVSILKLVEQKRLNLHETLAKIWHDAPADKAAITIHQLLTHTSGLPDDVGGDLEPLSRDGFVNRLMQADLVDKPGGKYHYSNAGYGLLAAVIEKRSGKSFETYLDEDVLEPAGLDHIGYETAYDDDRSLLSPRAWATSFQMKPIREASWGGHAPGWNLIGNGGLVTTPVDYLRFWSAVRQGRVIDKVLLRKALTPYVGEQPPEIRAYGYGLEVQDLAGHGRVYGHDGGNDLFSAEWRELGTTGPLFFTAGRGQDAVDAMQLILKESAQRGS